MSSLCSTKQWHNWVQGIRFISTDAKCGVIRKLLPPVHPLIPFSRTPGFVPAPRQGLSEPLFLRNYSPPPQSHFLSLTFVWHGQMETCWSVFRDYRNEVILKQGFDFRSHLASEAIWHPEKNNCSKMTRNNTEYKIHAFLECLDPQRKTNCFLL